MSSILARLPLYLMINTAVANERPVISAAAKKLTRTELTIKSNDNKSKSV